MKHRLEDYPGAGELTLWYEKPAHTDYKGWEQQALPIGNGYMGAKVFGGIRREQIQFNEKTLWTGGPGTPGYALGCTRDDNGQAMHEIQNMLAAGENEAAEKAMRGLQGSEAGLGAYQNFGTMFLIFPACVSAPVGNIAARLICARLFPALALRTRGCATRAPAL